MKNPNKETYNSIPVHYCRECLSLKIEGIPGTEDLDYCADCSSTDTDITSIEEWEKMYEQMYGHKYLTKSKRK